MANPLLAVRVPLAVRERIDRCAEAATAAAGVGARVIERGDVVRLLVMRELPVYEEELGCAPGPTKTAKAKQGKRGKK